MPSHPVSSAIFDKIGFQILCVQDITALTAESLDLALNSPWKYGMRPIRANGAAEMRSLLFYAVWVTY